MMGVYCQGGVSGELVENFILKRTKPLFMDMTVVVMDLYLDNSLLGSERDDQLPYSGLVAGRTGSFLHPHKSQQDLQAASVGSQRFRIRVHEAQRRYDVYCLSFMVDYAAAKVKLDLAGLSRADS
jgi:hypothetical protein